MSVWPKLLALLTFFVSAEQRASSSASQPQQRCMAIVPERQRALQHSYGRAAACCSQDRKSGRLGVPSFDCMQNRVADTQSRTPGWASVNAFAPVQLRVGVGARARTPVVCPLADTVGAAREE